MSANFRMPSFRRVLVMLLGIVLIAVGVALFTFSQMGSDPSTTFAISLGNILGVRMSSMIILCNSVYFLVEILFGRKLIGIGTFINALCIGPTAELILSWLSKVSWLHGGDLPFLPRLAIMVLGVLILSLSASMYQTADVGIAPYDALSIIMSRRQKKLPYFWCRIAVDSACVLLALLLGGFVGLGTLICSVGLGPFITFFDHTVSRPLCGLH